ncbi:peptidoglycan binding domain containing [Pyrenophora seminiperda CCB06]|uniref:Peptidoglycan binding domain containing n=1 Tax=Pyrenophora seminiperda CCB06 TaxID=1302712 RepID=A0A3M7M2R0_9PLEO|nr:peptidoglycan binding domain containing [Pyrenophora seminiperda CCB06]
MPSATTPRPPKRLAVFCDGTWVGRETKVEDAPPSNIRQLANMVGEVHYTNDTTSAAIHPIKPHTHSNSENITAGYQEGVGLNKNFLQYIWDGATAASISEECISVYKYIVENFDTDHEIWLFGFSRGAFTVRCVAGMINNCGIIKRRSEYTDAELYRLCYEVFRTYRSALPSDAPSSSECQRWKGLDAKVWQVKRPIRFMGVIDTVGALGIPRLQAGIGFDWSPFEFFDQSMSAVVQNVWHAPCLHDRLWIFQPCLVLPDSADEAQDDRTVVRQTWFPGTHYDVGRMTFRFLRQNPVNWMEEMLGWLPNLLSRTIYPNQVLSDAVLRWIVQGVREVDGESQTPLMPAADQDIQRLSEGLAKFATTASKEAEAVTASHYTGSGDIYSDVLAYAPAGILLSTLRNTFSTLTSLLNALLPSLDIGTNIQSLLGVKTLITILTATNDRRIPGTEADIYPYREEERVRVGGVETVVPSIESLGRMREVQRGGGRERYPSRTVEAFWLWKGVFGKEENGQGGGGGGGGGKGRVNGRVNGEIDGATDGVDGEVNGV